MLAIIESNGESDAKKCMENYSEIIAKDNYDIQTHTMFILGKGSELKEKIGNYRETVNGLIQNENL